MKVINKTAVVQRKNKIPMPIRHITTFGVNDSRVSAVLHLDQGDRAHVDYTQFSRLSPLVAPTFGNFKVKTHAFWVPSRTIWHHIGEYYNDSKDPSFNNIKSPLNFSLYDLWHTLTSATLMDKVFISVGYSPAYDSDIYDNCDIRWVKATSDGPSVTGLNFTDYGRLIWNNLQALGYSLPTYVIDATYNSTMDWDSYFPDARAYFNVKRYSAFPLLAMARCFYDWLYPSSYVMQQGYGYLFTDDLWFEWTDVDRQRKAINDCIELISTCYDRNFWTSLWAEPNSVSIGSNSSANYIYPTAHTSEFGDVLEVVDSDERSINDSFVAQSRSNYTTTLTATALRWMTSLSDYVLRNNIGGQRVQDYFKSHFGFTPSAIRDDISQWIDTFEDNVTIQDVTNMSTPLGSDGKPAVLGEQGGKGTSGGTNRLKFEASEAGFLVFITQIVPSVGYYQGIKEYCYARHSRFDLYHPDFDGVGMVGVPKSMLFSQYNKYADTQVLPVAEFDDVLGFAPMYADKKIGSDLLTGDFLFNSRNKGLDSYHTFRNILYGRSNIAIDRQFMSADNQYQRIFAYTGEENEQGQYAQYDKIFSFLRFDIDVFTDKKSLSESMPFFEDEGKKVATQYEGTQL